MEAAFRAHPLWAGCSEEELESAGEGLEKYVMTKLYDHVFASVPEDVKADEQLFEKMALVQQFIRPESLDIKSTFQNESSWLLAQKELQKINLHKAPREKLACILNCCKVITNLLHNAAVTANENTPGADEFLPVLIYVTLKANPPQLHSNLQYIQRYRSHSRMVSETAYYFTNILSAVSFISNIDAQALSMDEMEFERNMESAQAVLSGLTSDFENSTNAESVSTPKPLKYSQLTSSPNVKDASGQSHKSSHSSATRSASKDDLSSKDHSSFTKNMSISDLEEKGASTILKENDINNVFEEFPYTFASVGDLTLRDVEDLLNNYKKLVFKYACLARGLGVTPALPTPSLPQPRAHNLVEKEERPETSKESDSLNKSSQSGLEVAESRPLLQDTVLSLQGEERVEVSAVENSEQIVSEERLDALSNSPLNKAMAPSTEEQNHDIQ
ncbi:vacuolar protein sorting-associated protein 9A-like isoform X2 [Silene latifolia]